MKHCRSEGRLSRIRVSGEARARFRGTWSRTDRRPDAIVTIGNPGCPRAPPLGRLSQPGSESENMYDPGTGIGANTTHVPWYHPPRFTALDLLLGFILLIVVAAVLYVPISKRVASVRADN